MAEYIEREAALDCFACDLGKKDYSVSYQGFMTEAAFRINAVPAADVVPVVRCKDCEYWDATQEAPRSEGCFLCTLEGGYPKGDFYCALGERRMDGDGE